MIRVCLLGLGKTGKEIAKVLLEQPDIRLVAAICSSGSEKIGQDLGDVIGCAPTGIVVESVDNLEQVVNRTNPQVAVDFSSPEAAVRNARIFSEAGVKIVMGTTGFSQTAQKKLFVMTKAYQNGVVYAPNITLGVNVLMFLTNLTATMLNSYDFQITELHHKHKKDAPSGTALKIGREVARGMKLAGKHTIDVPINVVRAGGIIGRHEVMIAGEYDHITISHESFSRKAFAVGAIQAVKFIVDKVGYFEMSDVLNLKKTLKDYLDDANVSKEKRIRVWDESVEETAI